MTREYIRSHWRYAAFAAENMPKLMGEDGSRWWRCEPCSLGMGVNGSPFEDGIPFRAIPGIFSGTPMHKNAAFAPRCFGC